MMWQTISKQVVFSQPGQLTVEEHCILLPDGKRIEGWPLIQMRDFICVIPINHRKNALCFVQEKYAIEGMTLAPVGGYLAKDELPLIGAKRELEEEMGYQAATWIDLGRFRVDPNSGIAFGNFYLATNLLRVAHSMSDDLEDQHEIELTISELKKKTIKGEFKTMAWTTLALLVVDYIESDKLQT